MGIRAWLAAANVVLFVAGAPGPGAPGTAHIATAFDAALRAWV